MDIVELFIIILLIWIIGGAPTGKRNGANTAKLSKPPTRQSTGPVDVPRGKTKPRAQEARGD